MVWSREVKISSIELHRWLDLFKLITYGMHMDLILTVSNKHEAKYSMEDHMKYICELLKYLHTRE